MTFDFIFFRLESIAKIGFSSLFSFFRCQKQLPRKVRSRGRRLAAATPIGPILLATAPIGCVLHGAPLEPRGCSGWRPQTATRNFCHDHLRQMQRVAVRLFGWVSGLVVLRKQTRCLWSTWFVRYKMANKARRRTTDTETKRGLIV